MSAGALEIERLTALGERIGLTGKELRTFIENERAEIKAQRDEERKARAEEREFLKQQVLDEAARVNEEAARVKEEAAREAARVKEEREFLKQQTIAEAEREVAQKATRAQEEELRRIHEKQMETMKLGYEKEYKEMMHMHQLESSDKAVECEEKSLDKQILLEEIRLKQTEVTANSTQQSRPSLRTPKLPGFDENKDNIDAYLIRFERYAILQEWPAELWAVSLSALLSGKGLEVYYSLNETQANDYGMLKRAILNRYELNEEGFRKKFKTSKPEQGESGQQYVNRITNYFNRWFDLATNKKSKEGLIEMVIRDQFMHSISRDMATFVRERKPKDLGTLADLANQYVEARDGWWGTTSNPMKNKGSRNVVSSNKPTSDRKAYETPSKPHSTYRSSSNSTYRPSSSSTESAVRQRTTCYICQKVGHHARDCRHRPN